MYSSTKGYGGYNAITLANGSIANSCNVLGTTACEYSGFQAVAYESTDKSQVVIAYRGTDIGDDSITSVKNVLADESFKGTRPDADLTLSVTYAAQFLKYIQDNTPGATITITGHSLGGAIAELIGDASGLTTDSFNAPGAQQLYGALSTALSSVASQFKSGNGINNYRIFGDQVSLIGSPIGTQITLPPTTAAKFTTGGTLGEEVVANLDAIGEAHAMATVIIQITNLGLGTITPITNCSEPPCPGEPDFAQTLLNTLQPTAKVIPSQTEVLYKLIFSVLHGVGYVVDPTPGTEFVLTSEPGSPRFASLEFPSLSGVGSYEVRFRSRYGWSRMECIMPGVDKVFYDDIDSIKFAAFEETCYERERSQAWPEMRDHDYGHPVSLTDAFIFYATFLTSGQFSGSLRVRQE